MLGGGNPVSSANPAGIGNSLNIVGNHAYANNTAGASTTPSTILKFQTGNEYHVGQIQVNMGLEPDGTADAASYLQIKFDGQLVIVLIAGVTAADSMTAVSQKILIPPYTKVEATIHSNGDVATRIITVGYAGRIYA
jgi:hypothetical protein